MRQRESKDVTSAAETFQSLAYANVQPNRKTNPNTCLPQITLLINYISTDPVLSDIMSYFCIC